MKVWVVMHEYYSDTCIERVFSTQELAEEFARQRNALSTGSRDYVPHEWELMEVTEEYEELERLRSEWAEREGQEELK